MEDGRWRVVFSRQRIFIYFFFFLKKYCIFCKDLKHHIHPPYPPYAILVYLYDPDAVTVLDPFVVAKTLINFAAVPGAV